MQNVMVMQGRELHEADLELVRDLLAEHPAWGRTQLSEELCARWDWRNAQGRIKDMAARSLLLKLERGGFIQLPPRRSRSSNALRNRQPPFVPHETKPVAGPLRALRPLTIRIVAARSTDLRLFNCLLSRYHYLGHRNTVGENLRYLVRDRSGRPVAAALFGSSAWTCKARDAFIGWEPEARKRNLQGITNNTRFLILPWVTVPHLASHVLARLVRRIRADWQTKYGHPVHALETFVDRSRFRGTCYRAANWIRLGCTQGRSRNDRKHRLRTSVKDVYLYPLTPDFRQELCS